ncbi:LuxR C-terminal-related transcriptional regulator [Neobacillus massiliamazoniensis]|uniref:LuxR family transcriptional regulator n=1 Tax=Neobacillus massiliamazoniensis TaxID=1499688 RepID=A0A0U1NZF7_9BACI|nr:LuxR C-terminal-related transcriptional regulator [Neobacillus massiliamazoniensis]CRK83404.1 LuxR family transcriptional regulator [Neobacillus massiliamazoniensis]
MRPDLFPHNDISFEEFKIFLKTNKSQLQMNINVQIRLESNLSKEEQSIIEFLASSFLQILTEPNETKAQTDLDTLLNTWIQTYSMILNYHYLHRFYLTLEKAFANLLKNSKDVKAYSYMLYLPSIASRISNIFSNWNNTTKEEFHFHSSQSLLLSYLELFPIQQIYLVQDHITNPVIFGWGRSEDETSRGIPFYPIVDSNKGQLIELFEQSLRLKFGETSIYLYPKTTLEKEQEETISNYLFRFNIFASNNARYGKNSLNKLKVLDEFNKVLISCTGRNDFIKIIKGCEELLNYKRCVFYAYIPWSNEFKGVIGKELSKVQKTQGYVYPNQLFHTMIITRKPIFIKNPVNTVKNETIELFNLSSLIVAPIFHYEEVLGWMIFDQVGKEFDCTQEDLQLIEEVCNRIGLFLKNIGHNVSPSNKIELTDRELSVLTLLADGYDNKKMGEFLHLSEHTIRDYISSLMLKLKAKNRTQVVSSGFRLGLLT